METSPAFLLLQKDLINWRKWTKNKKYYNRFFLTVFLVLALLWFLSFIKGIMVFGILFFGIIGYLVSNYLFKRSRRSVRERIREIIKSNFFAWPEIIVISSGFSDVDDRKLSFNIPILLEEKSQVEEKLRMLPIERINYCDRMFTVTMIV